MRKRSSVFEARILALEQRWNPEAKAVSMESIRAQGAALSVKGPGSLDNIHLDRRNLDKCYRKSAQIRLRNPAL